MTDVDFIIKQFNDVSVDKSWAFADKTRKDTTYITHGYHRYPAKFIPQIASRLIYEYTQEGDLVLDPFTGCGTTLVESKFSGRRSVGTDINPVATLITKAKINAIDPIKLEKAFLKLEFQVKSYTSDLSIDLPEHERIDYWFRPEEKHKLAYILQLINELEDDELRTFFACAFSNSLKNCSIWLQKSNKPTRDLKKTPADPIVIFLRQVKSMKKGNLAYHDGLRQNGFLDTVSRVVSDDARNAPVADNTVDLVVTSPPYVTSYEYADLHQLSTLWFQYAENLSDFRKQFIGTSYPSEKVIELNSILAQTIHDELSQKHKRVAQSAAIYFSDMNQVFLEMHRVLKQKGKICIVIGNTKLKGVSINNAEVFVEQLESIGFQIYDIIQREIPSKNLPSVRDKKTGRFTSVTDKNKVLAYPTEYILVMEKL